MELYKNINGDSGVLGYEIGDNYIIVYFKSGASYTYTHLSAGANNIETMKILAKSGNGLNSFINKYVKKLYVRKLYV